MTKEEAVKRLDFVKEQKDDLLMANLANSFSDNKRTEEEDTRAKDIDFILCVEKLKTLSVLCSDDSEKYAKELEKEFEYYKNRLQWLVYLPQKGYDRVFFARVIFGIYYDNLKELIEGDSKYVFKRISDFEYIKDWVFIMISRCIDAKYTVFAQELIQSAMDVMAESWKMKTEDMDKLVKMKKMLNQ